MTDLIRTPKRLSDMDKKKEIVGSSDTPVITDKKVTTTPPTTSIGATTPSQSEDGYNENPQTPPQTMPAQPQPTQVAPTAPSLAAQPPGEEYNETPQAPPTTPAPAVTTTAPIQTPQYNDTDRRNQANLAAQTTTPTANETKVLQFDKDNKPILVDADADVATPTISPKPTDTAPSTTTPATEGEEYHTYRDILAKLAPQTSDEEKRKQMRRERRKAIVSALGDGLSALSNLYFTTKGAPDQGLKPGMTDAAKKRMDDLRAQWQNEKDKYQDLMLKGLDMDREQGNWLKSYELQKNADKRAEEELQIKKDEFEEGKKKREKEMAMLDEQIKKLRDDNDLDALTKKKRIAVKEKELEAREREYDDFIKYGMSAAQREANQETRRHNRAAESIDNRRLNIEERKADGSYNVYKGNDEKSLTKSEVDRVYMQMVRDGVASGRATTTQARLNVIQNYYGQGVRFSDNDSNKAVSKRSFAVTHKDYISRWRKSTVGEGAYDNF